MVNNIITIKTRLKISCMAGRLLFGDVKWNVCFQNLAQHIRGEGGDKPKAKSSVQNCS